MPSASNYPLVSVALASYNGERYIEEQLQSIYRQSYPRIEVIVSDDCSSDNTVAVLEREASLGRLRLLRQDANVGLVGNFERALSACNGAYVALADQDDIWRADKLARLVEQARVDRATLVYSNAALLGADGRSLNRTLRQSQAVVPVTGLGWRSLYFRNTVTGCTALVSREVLEKALPFPPGESGRYRRSAGCRNPAPRGPPGR